MRAMLDCQATVRAISFGLNNPATVLKPPAWAGRNNLLIHGVLFLRRFSYTLSVLLFPVSLKEFPV
jgi:hypothetical protein